MNGGPSCEQYPVLCCRGPKAGIRLFSGHSGLVRDVVGVGTRAEKVNWRHVGAYVDHLLTLCAA